MTYTDPITQENCPPCEYFNEDQAGLHNDTEWKIAYKNRTIHNSYGIRSLSFLKTRLATIGIRNLIFLTLQR